MSRPRLRPSAQRGFTLIELLVVIGILGMLMVAVYPAIANAIGAGESAETEARMNALVTSAKAFERQHGWYPPADFKSPDPEGYPVKAKADRVNAGIESLVMFLMWKKGDGAILDEHEEWLGNSDEDENDVEIPLLSRRAKVEVLDGWGNPFAYFQGGAFEKAQTVQLLNEGGEPGDVVSVRAWKNPRTGKYLRARGGFQIVSAGADLEFNTEDDVTYPKVPQDG